MVYSSVMIYFSIAYSILFFTTFIICACFLFSKDFNFIENKNIFRVLYFSFFVLFILLSFLFINYFARFLIFGIYFFYFILPILFIIDFKKTYLKEEIDLIKLSIISLFFTILPILIPFYNYLYFNPYLVLFSLLISEFIGIFIWFYYFKYILTARKSLSNIEN